MKAELFGGFFQLLGKSPLAVVPRGGAVDLVSKPSRDRWREEAHAETLPERTSRLRDEFAANCA
jgi:hypothetical protein